MLNFIQKISTPDYLTIILLAHTSLFTAYKQSWGKVMSLHVSVILSTMGLWYHFLSGPMFILGGVGPAGNVPGEWCVVSGGYGPRGGVWYPAPLYWYLVVATELGGTHPTGRDVPAWTDCKVIHYSPFWSNSKGQKLDNIKIQGKWKLMIKFFKEAWFLTTALLSLFVVSLHTRFASIIISSILYNIFSVTIMNNEFNTSIMIKDSFML